MNRAREIINDLEKKLLKAECHECNYEGHCTYCFRNLKAAEHLDRIKRNAS